eukprot:Skav203458  [mRNA]  locus=scaffold2237:170621:180592:- [translate_table: standard]
MLEESSERWRVLLDGKASNRGKTLEVDEDAIARFKCYDRSPCPCCTALDITQHDPAACVDRLLPFLEMDTVCFQGEQDLLAERQRQEWGPLREWFQNQYEVKLGLATGLASPNHPEETLLRITQQLLDRDPWELCALEIATQTAKSFIVASALLDKSSTAEEAIRLAQLEEDFQIERWGMVEGDHDVTETEMLKWLTACRKFGKLHRDE